MIKATRKSLTVEMSPTKILRTFIVSVVHLLLIVLQIQQQLILASGVFELEVLDFQQLTDLKPPDVVKSQQVDFKQLQNHKPIRINVCLKEAFASQLDGPCPFGESSITLNRDLDRNLHATAVIDQQANEQPVVASLAEQLPKTITNFTQESQQHQQRLSQGSQLTNLVRILFTFRWTKSFTIILTGEELQPTISGASVIRSPSLSSSSSSSSSLSPLSIGANLGSATGNGSGSTGNKSTPTTGDSLPAATTASALATSNKNQLIIDRHILTENEVLPNLDANPHKPWSSRFSRSLRSAISYRFRVYCSLNYFGDGCTTFCRPRDDQFGHYNCSATGQKVCLEGWTGSECDKAKCRPGCNQQHGYCDNQPGTCQCRPGWSGARCDECITYPGCQNGYCMSAWQCICHRNWGGVLCDQDLNYCGGHEPCKNNATCLNAGPGKYKCQCAAGFAGVDCEINLLANNPTGNSASTIMTQQQLGAGCALNPCLNGGTCYGFTEQLVDSPSAAAAASTETMNPTSDLLAQPANNPMMTDRFYRCHCAPGWTGDYCQWSELLPVTNLLLVNETKTAGDQRVNASISVMSEDETSKQDDVFELLAATTTTSGNLVVPFTTVNDPLMQSSTPAVTFLSLSHLISGVIIASAFGVILAVLLLTWTCLVAIKKSRLSFIQMSIVRHGADGEHIVSTTLRRMGSKIRDSFRRTSRIIPESKLESIDSVLRPQKPPPSYEESGSSDQYQKHVNRLAVEYPQIKLQTKPSLSQFSIASTSSNEDLEDNLVTKDPKKSKSYEHRVYNFEPSDYKQQHVTSVQIHCPKHGHLVVGANKQQATNHNRVSSIPSQQDLQQQQQVEYHINQSDLEQIDHYKRITRDLR